MPNLAIISQERTMTYLCLVYFEPKTMEGLSRSEKVTLDRDSVAYDGELGRNGHYIVSHALQPVSSAKTVRVRRGKASQVDGPFAETREHLGGFILINAVNMNEAVEIASKIPMAKMGSIEVRPVMKIDPDAH
jgi:hypothetical protein